MNRRRFLRTAVAAALPGNLRARVNGARLRENLEALSVFGRPAGGTFADGVSRVAFSDADIAGRAYVQKLIEGARLKPRIDAAGNIFALRPGSDSSLAPVLFGSHVDSVPSGGNFDGDLGTLAAIEVIRVLNEAQIATRRPLEIVVWCNEEGVAFNNGIFGSRAVAGRVEPGELDAVWSGMKKTDAIRKVGGNPDRIAEASARRAPSTAISSSTLSRAARSIAPAFLSESWMELWRSTDTMSRSAVSAITPELRPWTSAAMRWWPLRTSRSPSTRSYAVRRAARWVR